ncbi:hypothetical protein F2P81_018710 [Scophthalmus maximus]|uniref:Uncharacterized protein n=1 Tax=Scophthalmus maximus TaxID=52904 RepID=A0A6A4SB34_SCOMX|nr:hypothetical protein F2P81_018710 [Scophthalmus maximus]
MSTGGAVWQHLERLTGAKELQRNWHPFEASSTLSPPSRKVVRLLLQVEQIREASKKSFQIDDSSNLPKSIICYSAKLTKGEIGQARQVLRFPLLPSTSS